jgi:hypothetical protein
MADLVIRDIPSDLLQRLARDAERNRQSLEKHALFLIEQGLHDRPAETGDELIERIDRGPVPDVDDRLLETFSQRRGRFNRS